MTRTIIVNDREYAAFDWHEAPLIEGENQPARHARDHELLARGVHELAPGEACFHSDQTIPFDTTFALKGDGRKFVILQSVAGQHIAKPY